MSQIFPPHPEGHDGSAPLADEAGPGERGVLTEHRAAAPDPRALTLVIISDAAPGRNGVGTYYDDLIPHLEARVKAVHLIAPPTDPESDFDGWKFLMPGDPSQRMYVPAWNRLWKEIRALEPDVIVVASPGFYGVVGPLIAARTGAAFVTAHHTEISLLADLYFKGWIGWLYPTILKSADRWLFSRSDLIMVHNEELIEPVEARGGANIHLVGTVMPKAFMDAPPPPVPGEIRTVSFLGRLAPEKQLEQILEAAEAYPGITFHLVGEGPLRQTVEGWAASHENVRYTPWVARDKVMDFLDASDVVVLPSRYETFGTAALEAMARGRLVVVSRHCGIAAWEDLGTGLLRMEEGERLVSGLGRLLATPPKERQAMADRGRRAARGFIDRTVDHWLEVILEAVRSRTPA